MRNKNKYVKNVTIWTLLVTISFIVINNFDTSNSLPGYAGNEDCNYCHNQPALVKETEITSAMVDFLTADSFFKNNAQWTTNTVPVIQTNNRSISNLEFIPIEFLKNSTSVMVEAEIVDAS